MKKYFEKFKDLKSTNKKLYYATICMFVLVGFTFAYVIDQISGGAISRVFITADTSDTLEFVVDKDILIKPTQFNFTQGGVDLSDTATATARLKANSTDNTASYTYNVYFQISTNEYIYTTEDKKPEMLLQVTNPNGDIVKEISDVSYNENLNGFDITGVKELLVIAENYEISSHSSTSFTEQNWTIKVAFLNLDTNQIDNEGKTLEGKILIQANKIPDIEIDVGDLNNNSLANANIDCGNANVEYSPSKDGIIISSMNTKKMYCNLTYNYVEKEFLNQKIIDLSNTTQGDGKIINETASIVDYSNANFLNVEDYSNYSQFQATSSGASSGTVVSNVYTFNSNKKWVVNKNNMIYNKIYNFKTTIKQDGNYQFCLSMSTSSNTSSNYIYVYLNGTNVLSIQASQKYKKEGCINLGTLSADSNIIVSSTGNAVTREFYLRNSSVQKSLNEYRYEGANPNNYIWFNNELWRIVGVFDANNHGVADKMLTKIVREEPIANLSKDYVYNSLWKETDLLKVLNQYYLNSKNAVNSDLCYGIYFRWMDNYKTSYYKYVPGECDFTYYGIKPKFQLMISNTSWSSSNYKNDSIVDEYIQNISDNDSIYKVNSYIGLLAFSDYYFSVLSTNCRTKTSLIGNKNCLDNGWLFYNSDQVFTINDQGAVDAFGISGNQNNYALGVKPSLYLNSDVKIISGDGTLKSPYIIEN